MDAVIYIQLQNNLPQCLWYSLRKARELYSGPIYLIAPQRECHYKIFTELNISVLPKEKIEHPMITEYENRTFLTKLYPEWDGFWDNACKRFIYLYVFQLKHNIDKLIHIETDVLPYYNLTKMHQDFDKIYGKKMAFIPHADFQLNAGIMYSGSVEMAEQFSLAILDYFRRGQSWFNEKYPSQVIINETNFTYQFFIEHPEWCDTLPALPTDKHFDELKYLIDPDAWGRWVDGVRYDPGTPYTAGIYYIGAKILDGTYEVHFSFDGRKKKMPYAHNKITGVSTPIATLHFNSKEPHPWS